MGLPNVSYSAAMIYRPAAIKKSETEEEGGTTVVTGTTSGTPAPRLKNQ